MLEVAIVGPPSAGKSTIFRAATMKPVEIADYPFTTIDPNEGMAFYRVSCPDREIGKQCSSELCFSGKRFVPFKLWDVAGLVEGAHDGRGRGLDFLNDISRADVLIIAVDGSGNTTIEGLPGESNPVSVVRAIERELDYWYLSILEREERKIRGMAISMDIEDAIAQRFSGLKITPDMVRRAMELAGLDWNNAIEFASALRKLSKPVVIAANKADRGSQADRLRDYFTYPVVELSAYYELALREAAGRGIIEYVPGDREFRIISVTEAQKKALEKIEEFMRTRETGVQKLMNTAVETAGYFEVYPVEDEERWTDSKGRLLPEAKLVPEGTTAKQFAYMIHEDIGKGFIAAVDGRTKRRLSADAVLHKGQIISIKHRAKSQ